MTVALLTVGDEILIGDIVDTNAAWLGRLFAANGIAVVASATVGDEVPRIAAAIRTALADADDVVITGGLGPTPDDITREAMAEVAGVELRRDPVLEAALRERFTALRRDVPEMNWRQADVPDGATALPNPRGSAPGLLLSVDGRRVWALPGVPREMEAMAEGSVLPDLLARAAGPPVLSVTLRTAGRWESDVARALEHLPRPGLAIAYLAGGGEVRVRLTASDPDLLAAAEADARGVLGDDIYGTGTDTLPAAVHALLGDRTVATAESLTGGLLGHLLSQTPGASATYRGTIVAYATELKGGLLGVPAALLAERGPVDPDVAAAMATGVRDRLDATYGVALTGVAGPEPQGGRKPGTFFVAVAGPGGVTAAERLAPGDRPQVQRIAAVSGLDALRRTLLREG